MTNLIQDTLREDEEEQQSDTTSLDPKKCTSKKIQVETVDSSKQKIQVKKKIFTNIYHFVLNIYMACIIRRPFFSAVNF